MLSYPSPPISGGVSPGPRSSHGRTPSPRADPRGDSAEHLLRGANNETNGYVQGSTVPAQIPGHQALRPVDVAADAVDWRIERLEPVPDDPEEPHLTFWPTILKTGATSLLVLLYLTVAVSIVLLYHLPGSRRQYHISSENVHMIARYVPSVIGTVTVLLFRSTVREFIRMTPYVNMADQPGHPIRGEMASKSVSGAFFPRQDITVTKGFTSLVSLVCQILASFIVSLKVALFATQQTGNRAGSHWTLTVRFYPAMLLTAGHVMMALYTLFVAWSLKGKSTGLRWDPVSIADYVALFAQCNALEYFAPLELGRGKARKLMSSDQSFRLGYWRKVQYVPVDPHRPNRSNRQEETVYGIGITYNAPKVLPLRSSSDRDETKQRSWLQRLVYPKARPVPLPMHPHESPKEDEHLCAYGKWPKCEHYPFTTSPGIKPWIVVLSLIAVSAVLGFSVYALVKGWPFHDPAFHFANTWALGTNLTISLGDHGTTLPPIDPNDPRSTLLLYALAFRSAPTYVAELFTSTVIHWVDLNMRFMQPFRNMFGTPGSASETVLLSYITLSPLQVPLEAFDKQHYKVSWFSALSTISPLFPIFVGGLLTVSGGVEEVKLTFSLSAYFGVMVFLLIYLGSLTWAFPFPHRRLPRQFYSLADLMAMCHQSRFLSSPYLDIADPEQTPTKEDMMARMVVNREKFLFGRYLGRENPPQWHIGFDLVQTRDGDYRDLVVPIEPLGRLWKVHQELNKAAEATVRAVTFAGGPSKVTPHTFMRKRPATIKAKDHGRRAPNNETIRATESYEMSGGLSVPPAQPDDGQAAEASATGFQLRGLAQH